MCKSLNVYRINYRIYKIYRCPPNPDEIKHYMIQNEIEDNIMYKNYNFNN